MKLNATFFLCYYNSNTRRYIDEEVAFYVKDIELKVVQAQDESLNGVFLRFPHHNEIEVQLLKQCDSTD